MRNIITHVKMKLKNGLYSAIGLDGETIDEVPQMQYYGFKSIAKDGEAIVLSVNGSRSNPVIIASKGSFDISIESGETAIFTDKNSIILRADGSIEISSDTVKFDGNLEVSGNVKVSGGVTATGDVKAMGKSLATHIHSTPSGPSGPPI